MSIRGQYHSQSQNISVDLPTHLFSDDKNVIFHEVTHYFLSGYTNEGAVYSISAENLVPPRKLIVEENRVKRMLNLLHEDMYQAQEGIAHLMQSMQIYDDRGGMQDVKDWEDSLPQKPKIAFSFVKYALDLSRERRDNFIGKLSDISLNTNIYSKVIEDPNFLIGDGLESYLNDENNSSKKRFEKAARAIEKDLSLLDLNIEEICKKIGLDYHPLLSNKNKADLINAITSLTDAPTSVQESDIKTLSNPTEIFFPAFESVIVMDNNIVRDAQTNLKENEILDEAKYFRTIFIYNNPESPQKNGHFGFYSFSRRRRIINGSIVIGENSKKFLARENLTKIADTASFDFDKNLMKPERKFFEPDIIWHKNYPDLIPFILMAERTGLVIEKNTIAFTSDNPYRFYLLRVRGEEVLHISAGYKFIESKLSAAKFKQITVDFFEMISGKEKHLNNFFHDILGIPFLFDVVGMVKNAEEHLKIAEQAKNHGMERNEPCICGSGKKWKYCHGR